MEITTMSQATQLHAQTLKSPSTNPQTLTRIFNFASLSPSGNLTYAHSILTSLKATPINSYYHNTLIRAYSDSPNPILGLTLFIKWVDGQYPCAEKPDKFTFPFVLKSCWKLGRKRLGMGVHGMVVKSGLSRDLFVANALVSFYFGCGDVEVAVKVFDEMLVMDVVSWTAVIDGLVDNGRAVEALRYFNNMIIEGFEPNDVTVVAVLRACAESGALSVGVKVDKMVSGRGKGRELKKNVVTGLIDMYSKCGCIDSAMRVFSEAVDKDVYVWTAMISGLGSHGQCKEAIEFFKSMVSVGLKPDEKTMTAVLAACRNIGWVDEGLTYFKNIRKVYKLRPTVQHYGCIVDLLARSGRLNDAQEFIKSMPIEPDDVILRSLIWGCKVHGDTERLEDLIKHIELDKTNSCDDCGTYVLLGNVYASSGKWKNKANVRRLMNQKGLVKPSGHSLIEIDSVIYEFTAGSTCNVEAENIYKKLDEIGERLRVGGYDPKVSDVLLEIDDGEKASQLLHHSEKLAVSFGLMKTEPGTVIRIVKNLRSCEDCHSFMKHVSSVYKREILIRDRIRFHRFSDGECSCEDYW